MIGRAKRYNLNFFSRSCFIGMNVVLQVCFWFLSLFGIYSYLIYPLLLRLLPSREPNICDADGSVPSMTIIVTARNEETSIRTKLDNLFNLQAYAGDLEILVVSDASSDKTDSIVAEYSDRGVVLVRNASHDGKEAAQALAIDAAKGEILVFSDVATSMRGNVLTRIATHFDDPSIGALSSTDRFVDRGGQPTGEGAYVRYEMWLRRQESRVLSLVGLSGSFFAARAEICRKYWATTIPSDFTTAINCIREGSVAILADDVLGYYSDLANPTREYRRKVRTVVRGMRALAAVPEILNPWRYGLFAFQVWSHKIMRWLAPWFLLSVFIINLALLDGHGVYRLTFVLQALLYVFAAIGFFVRSARKLAIVQIPYYFVIANFAVMHAAIEHINGKAVVKWTPSER